MAVSLQDLLTPVTADAVEAQLLATLQGIGPVLQSGSGSGAVSVSGGPLGNYDAVLTITVGGAPGTASFSYSLDGGTTTAGTVAIPSSGVYVLAGTGLTFTFGGTFIVGDTYVFQTIYPPFPVTNWEAGGAGRVFVKGEASSIANLAGSAIPNVAGGGFVDYASSQNAPNDWLTLLSSQVYGNQRNGAQTLQGQAQLVLAASGTTQNIAAGALIAANSSGSGPNVLSYTNASPITITPGQTLSARMQAQSPGSAYNIANGALTVLKTPLPGLTISNPALGTSSVTHSGSGTGTVSVSGAPTGNYSVVLKILTSGGVGGATAQVSLDGGTDFQAPITIPGSGTLVLTQVDGVTSIGLTLTLAGSFIAADTYSFTSYASWILVAGQDVESAAALQSRDKSKWTTLGVGGGVSATYDYLARSTPNGGSEVVQVSSAPDSAVGGQVNVVVAGPTGPVSSSALASISAYLQARATLGSKLVVQNASIQSMAVTATVTVVAAQKDAANTAILLALSQLQASIPIAGLVEVAAIITAIESQSAAGVRNVGVPLTAPTTDQQLPAATVVSFSPITLNYVLV